MEDGRPPLRTHGARWRTGMPPRRPPVVGRTIFDIFVAPGDPRRPCGVDHRIRREGTSEPRLQNARSVPKWEATAAV